MMTVLCFESNAQDVIAVFIPGIKKNCDGCSAVRAERSREPLAG